MQILNLNKKLLVLLFKVLTESLETIETFQEKISVVAAVPFRVQICRRYAIDKKYAS